MTAEHLAECKRLGVLEDSYDDLMFAQSFVQGVGTWSSVPGCIVEATLYHTGLADQVDARAARYAVDDLLTLGGAAGVAKGATKFVAKNVRHYGARLGRLKGTVFDAGRGTSRSLSALDLARGNYSQRASNFEWLQAANRNLQGYRVPQAANSNSFFQDLQAVANSNTGARATAGNMSNAPHMSLGKGGGHNPTSVGTSSGTSAGSAASASDRSMGRDILTGKREPKNKGKVGECSAPIGRQANFTANRGTVYDHITPTAKNLTGTSIPATFTISVGGNSFWVHSNATKHMAEYLNRYFTTHTTSISSQSMLLSFHESLSTLLGRGPIKYNEVYNVGNWELIFSKKPSDKLPVIKHALYR